MTGHADVCNHAPVLSAGSPVTVERWAVMSGTQTRGSRLLQAKVVRLVEEMISNVQMPGTLALGWNSEARQHFTTHFIALSADAYATMY